MTVFPVLGAVVGVAASLVLAAPAMADGFSFRYDWSDGRGWGGQPHRGDRDGWGRDGWDRHDHRPRPPVVRDRFGRPLGYLVPSPYGPMVVERPRHHRHRPPPPPPYGWGWGAPRGW